MGACRRYTRLATRTFRPFPPTRHNTITTCSNDGLASRGEAAAIAASLAEPGGDQGKIEYVSVRRGRRQFRPASTTCMRSVRDRLQSADRRVRCAPAHRWPHQPRLECAAVLFRRDAGQKGRELRTRPHRRTLGSRRVSHPGADRLGYGLVEILAVSLPASEGFPQPDCGDRHHCKWTAVLASSGRPEGWADSRAIAS